MAFNSLHFLVFFPIVVLIYFLIPLKIRYIWLLLSSYYFYMCWNAKYALLILFSTTATYLCGLLLQRSNNSWDMTQRPRINKLILSACIIVNLGILFFFKYFDFAFSSLQFFCGKFGIQLSTPKLDLLLPVGISFYTFQSLGYIIDVYRADVKAEKNFAKYALFVSFFPQLVAGPIERSTNLLRQINKPTPFNVENARQGLFTMAYGLFLKMVVADNIACVIDPIFLDYENYHGMIIMMCMILFAFQIYCDFHGYTQIAIGSANILGFHLQENFRAPYLAGNIKEFWRNWHISLTSFFTDYLYIPLGGNRKSTLRKYVNTMIVFLASGLWHGASWAFVLWVGINGLYLVLYDLFQNAGKNLICKFKLDICAPGWKLFSRFITFLLVDYTWIYFRAGGLKQAFRIQQTICRNFHPAYLFSESCWAIFGSYTALLTILVSLIIIITTDYFQYKGLDWKKAVLRQQIVYRWLIYMALVFTIFAFGAFGTGNEQTQFIYFQF